MTNNLDTSYLLSQFFQKAGVTEAMNVYELFNTVSGLQMNSDNEADFLAQVRISCTINQMKTSQT